MALSIGDSVLDGYKQTASWLDNGVEWLEDLSEFYKERASIEREAGQRLGQLAAKFFTKKAAITAKLSVGNEPMTTPGSLENSSLQTWQCVLAQAESAAASRQTLADELQRHAGDELDVCRHRFEELSKSFKRFDDEVGERLKETYKKVKQAKHEYDASCESMESARAKNKKSADSKEQEMQRRKNDYLVQLNIANRMKDKHYHDDIPQLLDAVQHANEARVAQTNRILARAAGADAKYADAAAACAKTISAAVAANEPTKDTQMFIEHNANGFSWKDPADFVFEPSAIWHDNDKVFVGTSDATKYLQALLNTSYSRSEAAAEASQGALASFEAAKGKTERADFAALPPQQAAPLLRAETNTLRKLVDAESDRLEVEVAIETIEAATAAVDMSQVPQTQLKTHRTLFGKKKEVVEVAQSKPRGRTLGLTSLLARASITQPHAPQSAQPVTVLYDFAATGSGELSVRAGAMAVLLEPDDGSGWVRVELAGETGLVPSTYVQVMAEQQAPPPPPAPRGARKMEAIYAYAAQDASQLSMEPGDVILVTEQDDGCGWTTGQLNGVTGIFPTSYAQNV